MPTTSRVTIAVAMISAAAAHLGAQQSQPAPAKPDSPAIVEQLDRLKKSGSITDQEFARLRAKLVA